MTIENAYAVMKAPRTKNNKLVENIHRMMNHITDEDLKMAFIDLTENYRQVLPRNKKNEPISEELYDDMVYVANAKTNPELIDYFAHRTNGYAGPSPMVVNNECMRELIKTLLHEMFIYDKPATGLDVMDTVSLNMINGEYVAIAGGPAREGLGPNDGYDAVMMLAGMFDNPIDDSNTLDGPCVLFYPSDGTVLAYDPEGIYVVNIEHLAEFTDDDDANTKLCDEDEDMQESAIAIGTPLSDLIEAK